MKTKLFLLFIALLSLPIFLSCEKGKSETGGQTEMGTVWLSGGLYYCAEQIRLDAGDTLIVVNEEKILSFKSGDRVKVNYVKTDQNVSGCTIGTDCEIIDIEKID